MRYILIFTMLLLITGCFSEAEEEDLKDNLNLYEVCQESKKMCDTLVSDSVCKDLRRNVIIGNYVANTVEDIKIKEKYQYELLVDLENYVNCSKKATFIEYDYKKFERADIEQGRSADKVTKKELDERKAYRKNLQLRENKRDQNYIFANYMLRGLNQKTKMSANPYLLYWHWSRNGNEDSINKLEELYKAGKIKSYRMFFYLSQYYSKFDQEEGIKLMYKALENMPPKEYVDKEYDEKKHDSDTDGMSIHFPIFRTLTTHYYNQKNYKKAYVFAKLLEEKNDTTANIMKIARSLENNYSRDTLNKLEDVIEDIDSALEKGTFKKNML